jgi:hypothetical protein
MSNDNRTGVTRDPPLAEPPGGGRTDQESMRRAAHLKVKGPASTESLAAAGGLDVPGGEPDAAHSAEGAGDAASLIPGAREADTLTHREPGAIGGIFTGADIPDGGAELIDERTSLEREREGGLDRHGANRRGSHG